MDEIQIVNRTVHSSLFFRKIVEIERPLNRIITHPHGKLDSVYLKPRWLPERVAARS